MRYLQRVLLLFFLLVMLVVFPYWGERHKDSYYMDMRRKAEAEYFFYQLCEKACITTEEYEKFCMTMQYAGCTGEIELQEYQKRRSTKGQTYRFLISWEEIKEILQENGSYCFVEESEIRLYWEKETLYGEVGGSR